MVYMMIERDRKEEKSIWRKKVVKGVWWEKERYSELCDDKKRERERGILWKKGKERTW